MGRTGQVVKTISDRTGTREVRILRHGDGTYGFEEWSFGRDPYIRDWSPDNQPIRTFTDSADAAEREARARVDWLIGEAADLRDGEKTLERE